MSGSPRGSLSSMAVASCCMCWAWRGPAVWISYVAAREVLAQPLRRETELGRGVRALAERDDGVLLRALHPDWWRQRWLRRAYFAQWPLAALGAALWGAFRVRKLARRGLKVSA